MAHRITLRRKDGRIYLERHGISTKPAGIYFHTMTAPDPGPDLHDHPWWFLSWVIQGGYTEKRASTREPGKWKLVKRRRWSFKPMRLDECHQIVQLHEPKVRTIIFRGPRRRTWGFYVETPKFETFEADDGMPGIRMDTQYQWMPAKEYDKLLGERRELKEEDRA